MRSAALKRRRAPRHPGHVHHRPERRNGRGHGPSLEARRTMLSSRSEPLWYATGWPQLRYKRYRDHLNDLVRERTRQLALTQKPPLLLWQSLAEWRDTETGAHHPPHAELRQGPGQTHVRPARLCGTAGTDAIFWLYLSAPLHDAWARWPLPTPYCTSRGPYR